MEQSADEVTPDEIEVAEILVNLHHLIFESEFRPRFSFWGFKKKRSVPQEKNPTPSPPPPPPAQPQQSPPPPKNTEAASPATPLSFSPSESEEKPKSRKRKLSLKRTKEEQLKMIEELTQRRELLFKEIENVKSYYDKLKAYNSALKNRKLQLINIGVPRGEVLSYAAAQFGSGNQVHPLFHQQGMMMNQAGEISSLEGVRDKVGPREIPDLNVSLLEEEASGLECFEPCDVNRVRAAQARMKRKQICKMKNSTAYSKSRAV